MSAEVIEEVALPAITKAVIVAKGVVKATFDDGLTRNMGTKEFKEYEGDHVYEVVEAGYKGCDLNLELDDPEPVPEKDTEEAVEVAEENGDSKVEIVEEDKDKDSTSAKDEEEEVEDKAEEAEEKAPPKKRGRKKGVKNGEGASARTPKKIPTPASRKLPGREKRMSGIVRYSGDEPV